MKKPRILLAIPCYNCERQIKRVISGFDENLASHFEKIMIIDNGSRDQTMQSAKEEIEKLKFGRFQVVKNQSNYLLGGTHKVAFLEAIHLNCTHLAIIHGDAQAIPKDILPQLEAVYKNASLDATLATRFSAESKRINYSRIREYGNRALNLLYGLFTWKSIMDLGGCITIFKIDSMPKREFLNFTDGFTFNNELLLYLIEKKKYYSFFPITWIESDQVSNVFAPRIGYKMTKTLLKWYFFGSAIKPYREQGENYYRYNVFYSNFS